MERLLNQTDKTKAEIAIEIMLWIMRRQMFIVGNKRVGMLFANKIEWIYETSIDGINLNNNN